MKSRRYVSVLTALVAPILLPSEPASAQEIAEAGWTLLRSIDLVAPHGARFDPNDSRTLYFARRSRQDGVYQIDGFGLERKVATSSNPAALLVEPSSGDLFFAEDFGGQIFRLATGASARASWAAGFHDGDDDPTGLALAPPTYSGNVIAPGDALMVDRGVTGPDEVWIWSTTAAGSGTVLHADNGTLTDPIDAAISDTTIYLVDRGAIAETDGAIYRVGVGGALTPLLLAGGAVLVDPIGIVVDPTDGTLLVADGETLSVVRVNPESGAVSSVITGLALPVDGFGPIDLSADGRQLAITVADKILVYGRCDATAGAADCDGNGTADVCDFFAAQSIDHKDCDLNGVLDICDLTDNTHTDCNDDQVPDVCPTCPPVETVFIMDTSNSMTAEATALCGKLQFVAAALKTRGIDLRTQVLGVADNPGGSFDCLESSVLAEYGETLPGDPPASLGPFGDCAGGVQVASEDWGRAVAVAAAQKPWSDGTVRTIVVLADEGPHCGDPVTDPGVDRDAIEHAIAVARENRVVVSVVAASGSSAAVQAIAADLASGTGGTTFESTAAERDLADGIRDIIVQGCSAFSDCDGDETPDQCQSPPPTCTNFDAGPSDDAAADAGPNDAGAGLRDAGPADQGQSSDSTSGGLPDATVGGETPADESGCDCRVSVSPGHSLWSLLGLLAIALRRRRRRS